MWSVLWNPINVTFDKTISFVDVAPSHLGGQGSVSSVLEEPNRPHTGLILLHFKETRTEGLTDL